MSGDNIFLTHAFNDRAGQDDSPPLPTSSGELYLVALLETQSGLRAGSKALVARAAAAGADETRYIRIQEGLIDADYLRVAAMITAYLTREEIFKPISPAELAHIRQVVERLNGYTAGLNKAADIVRAVTDMLATWTPERVAAPAVDKAALAGVPAHT